MTEDEIMQMTPEELRLKIAEAKGFDVRERVWRTREYRMAHDTEHKELAIWIDPTNPKHPQWGGGWHSLPNWPADIAAAWGLVEEGRKAVFSRRLAFYKYLQEVVSQDVTDRGCEPPMAVTVSWPDVLTFLEPVHICRAWLMWKAAQ